MNLEFDDMPESLPTAISSVSHGARSPAHCIVTGLQPLQTDVTQNSGFAAAEKEKCGKDQHVTQHSDTAVGPDHTAHAPQCPFNMKQAASETRLESRRAGNSDASRFMWRLRHLQDSLLP